MLSILVELNIKNILEGDKSPGQVFIRILFAAHLIGVGEARGPESGHWLGCRFALLYTFLR